MLSCILEYTPFICHALGAIVSIIDMPLKNRAKKYETETVYIFQILRGLQ